MGRYQINDEIMFGIEVGIAHNLYNRQRRKERKEFKREMRRLEKLGKSHPHYGKFLVHKKCGRARP